MVTPSRSNEEVKDVMRQGNGDVAVGEPRTRTIFIVDDDRALSEMLSIVLETAGYQTVTCMDGLRAVELYAAIKPDLILLDVMLPGISGVEVARRIRRVSNVPIIMLTAKADTSDVVLGLEAGADDYIPKPFKVEELTARIHARFRILDILPEKNSGNGRVSSETVLECGTIVMDRLAHTASKSGVDLHLTPMEFELLFVLASKEGEVMSRASLLQQVWGYSNAGDTRLVNVHVQRLRAKIEADPENPQIIRTVRGVGYRFVAPRS